MRPAEVGTIEANLTIGVDLDQAKQLLANDQICSPGVKLHGSGFIVTPEKAATLGLGVVEGLDRHIRHYRNGKVLTQRPRGVMVIDFFGLEEAELRACFPAAYQHLLQAVKPERVSKVGRSKGMAAYAARWWVFGKPRSELRPALDGLPRYIATVETTKHRVFQFLDAAILPDNMLVNIALDDAFFLGVHSSRPMFAGRWPRAVGWALATTRTTVSHAASILFLSPDVNEAFRKGICDLAEELGAHRKKVLTEHADLTLTGLYNILEKLKAGEALSDKEKSVHQRGLVSMMRHLHDEIDHTVAEILSRLVTLNKERVAEEARGEVRWLRPAYQAPKVGRSRADRLGHRAGRCSAVCAKAVLAYRRVGSHRHRARPHRPPALTSWRPTSNAAPSRTTSPESSKPWSTSASPERSTTVATSPEIRSCGCQPVARATNANH